MFQIKYQLVIEFPEMIKISICRYKQLPGKLRFKRKDFKNEYTEISQSIYKFSFPIPRCQYFTTFLISTEPRE